MELSYSPGGCAQNTLRILQWLLKEPSSTIIFGSIGNDLQGKTLQHHVEKAGVKTRYEQHLTLPTGTSIGLISGSNRSLVAYLGAAQYLNCKHLQDQESQLILDKTDLIYMEGFFLEKSESARYIMKFCMDRKTLIAFNISAQYVSESNPQATLEFVQKCNIVFGNEKEFNALCKNNNIHGSVTDFAITLSKSYHDNTNLKYGKIVIITNGSYPVLCVHSNGKLDEIIVPCIEMINIKDTTGAGDSFVAGFLAGLMAGYEPRICVQCGCWTAQQIIQQIGCTVPAYPASIPQFACETVE